MTESQWILKNRRWISSSEWICELKKNVIFTVISKLEERQHILIKRKHTEWKAKYSIIDILIEHNSNNEFLRKQSIEVKFSLKIVSWIHDSNSN